MKKILPCGLALAGLALVAASSGVLALHGWESVNAAVEGHQYTLVSNVSQLSKGASIIITNAASSTTDPTYAMGTYSSGNNIKGIAAGSGDTLAFTVETSESNKVLTVHDESIGSITLESFATDTTTTLSLKDENGKYLYAANNSSTNPKNYLKTKTSEVIWTLSFVDGVPTLQDTTSDCHGRNLMRFNQDNSLFSCYGSGQKDIAIWVHSGEVASLESIAITGSLTKTAYQTGDLWDPSGLVVTATLSDNTQSVVTDDVEWSYSPANPDTGVTSVAMTASYTYLGVTKTATFNADVTFAAKEVLSIAVKTLPDTVTYNLGDKIDYTGLVITATFSDSTSSDISDLSVLEFNPAEGSSLESAGENDVTVTYEGKSTTFKIDVSAVSFAPIENPGFSYNVDFFRDDSGMEFQWVWQENENNKTISWNSSKGVQFGSNNKYANVTVRIPLTPGFLVEEVVVNTSTNSRKSSTITVSLTQGGAVTSFLCNGAASATAGSSPTDYSFTIENPAPGHVDVSIASESETTAVYIKSISVFGAVDTVGYSAIAKAVEDFDHCATGADYTTLKASYDSWAAGKSEEQIATLRAIKLDDWASLDTAHEQAKIFGNTTVGDKLDFLASKFNQNSGGALGLSGEFTTFAIVASVLAAGIIIAAAGTIITTKRKRA